MIVRKAAAAFANARKWINKNPDKLFQDNMNKLLITGKALKKLFQLIMMFCSYFAFSMQPGYFNHSTINFLQ